MIRSQHLQAVRGRTMRFTMKRSGIFQFLGYILAEAAQIAASFARLTGAKNLFITRQCRR